MLGVCIVCVCGADVLILHQEPAWEVTVEDGVDSDEVRQHLGVFAFCYVTRERLVHAVFCQEPDEEIIWIDDNSDQEEQVTTRCLVCVCAECDW
jgi:hypothetical protein